MGRRQLAGACVALAALAVTGGAFALLGFAAATMSGGTALTNLLGLGGAVLGGSAFVTLLGTGLSPGDEQDEARAGRVLRLLIPLSGVLSLMLLLVLVTD